MLSIRTFDTSLSGACIPSEGEDEVRPAIVLLLLVVVPGAVGTEAGGGEVFKLPRAASSFSDLFLRSQHTLFSPPIRLRVTIPWQ